MSDVTGIYCQVKGQYWTAAQQLKWRDWQGIFVRMPGTASQSAERRRGRGAENVIRKFLKLIATAQVFPDATDFFHTPWTEANSLVQQTRGRCFHVVQHSREQLWRPAFLWQSFFWEVEHTPSPIAYRKVCTYRVSCSDPSGWNLGHVSRPSIFNTTHVLPSKRSLITAWGSSLTTEFHIVHEPSAHSLMSLPQGMWMQALQQGNAMLT